MKITIKDSFVKLFYRLFSVVSVSKDIRQRNYEKNINAWNDYKERYLSGGYIEHQAALTNMIYGRNYSADYNSCEIIALYNALRSFIADEKDINAISFPKLLTQFEKRGITWGGAYGTSPFALFKYFKMAGFDIKGYSYRQWMRICAKEKDRADFENVFDTFIFMAYNNAKTVKDMIHTMCITKENGQYKIHNDYEGSRSYDSLFSAVTGYKNGQSRLIIIFGIRKQ